MHDSPIYYHGTKADLAIGAMIEPGRTSNYGRRNPANSLKQLAHRWACAYQAAQTLRGRIAMFVFRLRHTARLSQTQPIMHRLVLQPSARVQGIHAHDGSIIR